MKVFILISSLIFSIQVFAMDKLVISKTSTSPVILKIETTKFTGGSIQSANEKQTFAKKYIAEGDAVTTVELKNLEHGDLIFYQLDVVVKPLHKDATLKISLWQDGKELYPEFHHPYEEFDNLAYELLQLPPPTFRWPNLQIAILEYMIFKE